MKKIPILLAFIAGTMFTTIISWENKSAENHPAIKNQNPDSRPVLAVRKIKLKEGVTAEAFEKFAIKAKNGEYCVLPGVKIYFGKGERGDEPDTYMYFLEFDSKATRDFYVPESENNTKAGPDAKKLVEAFVNNFLAEFNKLADYKVTGKKGYTDYIILE